MKPVHLIFSDPIVFRILRFYQIQIYCQAKEAADQDISREHYHVLAAWPIRSSSHGFRAKPPKGNFCRSLRRLNKCINCKTWLNGNFCYFCTLYIKFKWISSPNYFENTYNYIAQKPGATLSIPLLAGTQQTNEQR